MKAIPARQSPTGNEPLVLCEHKDGVAILTLNRPDKRNTLSRQMLVSLRDIFDAIRDDPDVRVVILGANGTVFSSGHDMKEVLGNNRDGIESLFSLSTGVMEAIRLSPKPVIAQVQGLATAAGCQLVASCDLAVAASSAGFQTPGVHIGLFCSTPMVPLSRAVPLKKAMEMLLTGEAISAEEAYRVGLVNHVVPPEELAAATMQLAQKIIPFSSYTIALGKQAFYKQLALDQSSAYEVGKEAMVRNALAEDAHEGMSAFLEKRQPRWKHR
ncbi:MAG: enoyl-CoA hydratase [SAR324 cluster bacterium]|nr:enoyl-CoA hydratase [SAR324 cluster bacterium]